jgi:hypothetical protein
MTAAEWQRAAPSRCRRTTEDWRRPHRKDDTFKYPLFEGKDIGEDTGSPIDFSYAPPFKFTGQIGKVMIDLKTEWRRWARCSDGRTAKGPVGVITGKSRCFSKALPLTANWRKMWCWCTRRETSDG